MSKFRHRSLHLLGVLLTGLLFTLLAACSKANPQSTFDTLGPVSRNQATILYVIAGVGTFVFILVFGILAYTVIRYRRRSPDDPDPPQIHGNDKLEVAWTIAPAIVLIAVAVPTLQGIFYAANPPTEARLTVEATGHQWWFEFKYPELGVVTANEMHIPEDEAVIVELRSVDVNHSFWVPKLAGKVDMIPNNENRLWLQADESGMYYGQCAEFCGESHAKMRFRVVVEPRAEFDAWVARQQAAAAVPGDPLAKEGHDLFMSNQARCFACHTIAGTQKARGTVGPNLTHFASRQHLAAGNLENTQENLRMWLEDPDAVKPGNLMSRDAAVYNGQGEPLTEPQISALVAFLRSLE